MAFKSKTHFEQVPLEIVRKIAIVDEKKETSERAETNKILEEKTKDVPAGSAKGLQAMNSSFDIFQVEADGRVLWQGSAENMDEGKARVKELQARASAPYMIVSLKNGTRLHIDTDGQGLEQVQDGRSGVS